MTGVYRKPTFYTKVTNSSNITILESNQNKRNIVSKDVACILKQLLTEPVKGSNGTATYCKISNQDVAAKTGTTNDNYDRWLCGFTNYYTAVCWYGFDKNESIEYNGKNPAGLIWKDIMSKLHTNLPTSKFEITRGVTTLTICQDSGLIARNTCPHTYTEYFLNGTAPTEICSTH